MKQETTTIIAGLGGLLLGFLILPLFFGMWGWNHMGWSPMMGNRNYQNSGNMMGNIDAHFIEQMIPHHEDAILMANIALTKAEHSEIKQLSQNIKTSQSTEIAQMQSWYKLWYGTNVPGTFSQGGMMGGGMMMQGGMMGDSSDPESLKTAKPFDKAFIEEMIPHHQMAVMMATMLLRGTNREEMKTLGQNIIDAQIREIEQMRSWYRTWYGQ